jgi:translation initiation factor IF-3
LITSSEVRLIDADGSQAGVVSIEEARRRALEAGLDLVEVSPQATPPVCRVMDWGKYHYQKLKQQQKAKKKQKTSEVKQIRFGMKIGQHDLDIKLKKAAQFLDDGHHVKLTAFFRGREMAHQDLGFERIETVLADLEKLCPVQVEQKPILSGKQLSMLIKKG